MLSDKNYHEQAGTMCTTIWDAYVDIVQSEFFACTLMYFYESMKYLCLYSVGNESSGCLPVSMGTLT